MSIEIIYIRKELDLILTGWSTLHDIDAEELISIHLEQMFRVPEVRILNIVNNDDFLTLTLESEAWQGRKEFSLLDNGSIATDY